MKTLISNGTICLEGEVVKADLAIRDEKVEALGAGFDAGEFDTVIDAAGKYVVPGGVDAHTHMALQQTPKYRAVDDFFDGGVAAACGGTTTIIDHMGFGEPGCTLESRFEEYLGMAERCPIDYSFHGVFQHVTDDVLAELDRLVTEKGYQSYKAYTTYGFPIHDDGLLAILQVMKRTDGLLTVHSENDAICTTLRQQFAEQGHLEPIYHALSRPNAAEAEAVGRLVQLAKVAGDAPLYIVHLSAHESLEPVRAARAAGQQNIFVETCTQYLMLTDTMFSEGGPSKGILYMLAPPLRKEIDNVELWKAVADGEVQVVATDHCPFKPEQKLEHVDDYRGAPGGMSGVEERMPVMFSEGVVKGRLTLERFVQVTAANPARIFGMYPAKGTLLPGSDADVTIIDPHRSRVFATDNLRTTAGYSPYEGLKVDCVIDTVLSRGAVVARDNEFVGERGRGRFVARRAGVTTVR